MILLILILTSSVFAQKRDSSWTDPKSQNIFDNCDWNAKPVLINIKNTCGEDAKKITSSNQGGRIKTDHVCTGVVTCDMRDIKYKDNFRKDIIIQDNGKNIGSTKEAMNVLLGVNLSVICDADNANTHEDGIVECPSPAECLAYDSPSIQKMLDESKTYINGAGKQSTKALPQNESTYRAQ